MSIEKFANLLQDADAPEIIEFLEEPLDKIDGEEWQERAGEMLASVIPALIWEKENEAIEIDAGNVQNFFELGNLIRLARHTDMPEMLQEGLLDYLHIIPGFDDSLFDDDGNPTEQDEDAEADIVEHQHNHLVSLFFEALG